MVLENSAPSSSNDASSVQGNHNHGPNKTSIHPNIYQQMSNHAPLFLNPHAIAQAATVALTAAAQQVAQQQQQQATNSHNASVANAPFASNGHPNTHAGPVSALVNPKTNSENDNSMTNALPTNQQGSTHQTQSTTSQTNNKLTPGIIPAPSMPEAMAPVMPNAPAAPQAFPSPNPQQIALNPQIAGLLASNGLNPALLLNAANLQTHNHNPTMAAAQAFVQLLQQQQQSQQQVQQQQAQTQQQQQQVQQMGQPQHQQVQQQQVQAQQSSQSTTQGMIPNVSSHFQEKPSQQQQHNSTHKSISTADTTKPSNANPMIQHFNHSSPSQNSLLNGRNTTQAVKKMGNGNDSLASSLISYSANQEKRTPKETMNVPSMLATANTPVSQPTPQQQQTGNVSSLYAAASNNPMFFAQMQSWKLEQLGKLSFTAFCFSCIFLFLNYVQTNLTLFVHLLILDE